VQVINTCREWEGAAGNGQLAGNGWMIWYKSLNNLPPESNRDGQDPTVLYYALAPQSCNNGLGPDADACYSALFNILDECVEPIETGNIGNSYGGHYGNNTCFEYGIELSWEELLSKSVLAPCATGSSGTPSLSGLIPLATPTDGPSSSSPPASLNRARYHLQLQSLSSQGARSLAPTPVVTDVFLALRLLQSPHKSLYPRIRS